MSQHKYKMTVIVPSYNNGQYMRQCLDSILEQSVDFHYQIIITDDHSQDNSIEIIKEYEAKFPDKILALYSSQNCKLFKNVLKALEKMDSDYFCVLDPDDYWSDMKRLQKAVDFLEKNPEYSIYSTNCYVLYDDERIEPKYNYPGIEHFTSTYEDYLSGINYDFDDLDNIRKYVLECYLNWENGTETFQCSEEEIRKYSRENLTQKLAGVFNNLLDQ